jgi:predicted ArsR family transcriptional regulator
MTATEQALAELRRIIPAIPPDDDDPAGTVKAARAVLWPGPNHRERIVAYVALVGAARPTQIAGALHIPRSSMSRHMDALVTQGRLAREEFGVYVIPGQVPAELPAHPLAGRPRGW